MQINPSNKPIITIVPVGKYKFKITETIMAFEDRIISHTFKIGGDYDNCISVSYTYNNNKPVSATIPHALYEPECSTENPLEKGEGTVIMLKTLLKHVYSKIPTIHIFSFDDMSNIDCVEKDLKKSIPRSPTKPLNLAYFSIAYNSETWYEKQFNAKMTNSSKYTKYKKSLEFLTDPTAKLDFIKFLEITKPNETDYKYLESVYNKSKTYREFFEAMPKTKRCDILFNWLTSFMEYYLKNIYSPKDWEIDILEMNTTVGGSKGSKGSKSEAYPKKYRLVEFRRRDMM